MEGRWPTAEEGVQPLHSFCKTRFLCTACLRASEHTESAAGARRNWWLPGVEVRWLVFLPASDALQGGRFACVLRFCKWHHQPSTMRERLCALARVYPFEGRANKNQTSELSICRFYFTGVVCFDFIWSITRVNDQRLRSSFSFILSAQ